MIVLFDGVCNLCSKAVQFTLIRDEAGVVKFASLQSEYAKSLLRERGVPLTDPPTSIFVFEDGNHYQESTAALRVLGKLRFPWNLLKALLVIPTALRDPIYRLIARNRYSWFGRQDTCWLPRPEWKDRFIESEGQNR